MEPDWSHPILSCDEAKAWEAQLLSTEEIEWQAMNHAAEQIAGAIAIDFEEIGGLPADARLLVLVGKGHNGGDALLAARAILGKFPRASTAILFCFGETAMRPLAQRALRQLRQMAGARCQSVTFAELKKEPGVYDLCLDGIFGFQFRPPLDEKTAEVLAWINGHSPIRFRAAIDLPSGVSKEAAPHAFRADFTYATGIVKSPVVIEANGEWVGRLRYLDLGFFVAKKTVSKQQVLIDRVLMPLAGLRSSRSDKRTYRHLCVIGGSHSYPGAVVLAVRAALRSGVGLVTALVPEALAPHYAAEHPEVMWVGCRQNSAGGLGPDCLPSVREKLDRADALLVGPGLGADSETLEMVRQIAAEVKVPVLFDADALRPEVITEVRKKTFVCTPHAGEFKRIGPVLYSGDEFVAPCGVLVLKGPLTHVTNAHGTYYSPFGGPVLARGGSGDMLAGLIGGLLAQSPDDPLLAACRGVVWHGLAADLLARAHGQVAVENSQLLEQLGPALTSTHARNIDGAAGVHGPERPA